MPKRVLGYARVSSAEQALGTSLSDQQDVIKRYAEARSLTVANIYVEAESAIHEKVERREQIQALLREVRKGDLILCDKLDRWSRDPEFTYGSVRRILSAGASFYAIGDACDPSTPEGDTMLGFRVLFAREEHKRIRQRLVGTRELLLTKGYYVGGHPPLGYRRQDEAASRLERNILVPVPEEAELVKSIYRRYVAGESMTQLANRLGLKLDRIKDVLTRRTYLGEVPAGGRWVKGHHEPLIDVELWQRAQDTIARRTLGGPRPRDAVSQTSDWILRDVARCGACGGKMSAAYGRKKKSGHRNYYYLCSKQCGVPMARVDAAEEVGSALILKRLSELRTELAKSPAVQPTARPLADLAEKRAKLQRKRERLLEAHANELMTLEELRAALAKLQTDITRLDAQEAGMKKPAALSDPKVRRAVLADLSALTKAWKHATPQEQREIVGILVNSVAVRKDEKPVFSWKTPEELAAKKS